MHCVLLSVANIIADVQMKATAHVFTLTSYIPTPHWLNVSKEVTAVFTACLYHTYIDITTKILE